jgi:hypothetical protein
MVFWIAKIIIFSIIFIFLIHNILNFLFETLTISKTKDMVQITNQNYKNIYEVLSRNVNDRNVNDRNVNDRNVNDRNVNDRNNETEINQFDTNDNLTLINSLPNNISTDDTMKNELSHYLRQQLNN